jgi:hypothetical protein
LHKFKKNVLSFPQETGAFAMSLGLLCHYRVGDRVNSSRGPGRDIGRPCLRRSDFPSADCGLAVDENGFIVFPASVVDVKGDGRLELKYDKLESTGQRPTSHQLGSASNTT